MKKNKTYQLSGMMAISFDEHGNVLVQFLPDEPYSVELDSILLEGSAQLLRSGQLDFISNNVKELKIS